MWRIECWYCNSACVNPAVGSFLYSNSLSQQGACYLVKSGVFRAAFLILISWELYILRSVRHPLDPFCEQLWKPSHMLYSIDKTAIKKKKAAGCVFFLLWSVLVCIYIHIFPISFIICKHWSDSHTFTHSFEYRGKLALAIVFLWGGRKMTQKKYRNL